MEIAVHMLMQHDVWAAKLEEHIKANHGVALVDAARHRMDAGSLSATRVQALLTSTPALEELAFEHVS